MLHILCLKTECERRSEMKEALSCFKTEKNVERKTAHTLICDQIIEYFR